MLFEESKLPLWQIICSFGGKRKRNKCKQNKETTQGLFIFYFSWL